MADPAEQITETDITGNDELALIRQEREALAKERQSTGQLRSAVATPTGAPDIVSRASESALTDLERLRKSQEEQQGLYKQREGALAPLRERILAELDRQEKEVPGPPGAPRPPPIPTREQSIDQTAAKSLFAIASFIGALGMAGGRGRGMLAMAGMRGAIQGFQEGNAEKYKDSLAQYKAAVNEQLDQYDMQYKSYLAILKQSGMSLDRKIMAYDLEAARFQDQIGANAAQQKDIGAMIKHADEIAKTAATLRNRSDADILKLQSAQLGLQSKELDIQKKEVELEKTRTKAEHPDDSKPAGPGMYYDKQAGEFAPYVPTRGEVRENPGRFVRVSNEDKRAIEFLFTAKDELPYIEKLAKDVLSTKGLLSVPGQYLSSATAGMRSGEAAEKMKEFKQRTSALKLQAGRLETGTSRVIGAVLQQVVEQVPAVTDERNNAVTQLKTLRNLIDLRLNRFLQGGESGVAGISEAGKANYPTAVNPKTGEKLIYKDGQWQKP